MANYDKFISTKFYYFMNLKMYQVCNQIVRCSLLFFYSLLYKFKINTNIWIHIHMNLNIASKRTYMSLNVDLLKLTILILNNF